MLQQLKNIRKLRKNYLAIYHTKIVTLNEENTHTRFRDFKRLLKMPFTIYAHFEIILKPATDNKRKWKHILKNIKTILFAVMVAS